MTTKDDFYLKHEKDIKILWNWNKCNEKEKILAGLYFTHGVPVEIALDYLEDKKTKLLKEYEEFKQNDKT